MFNRVEYKKNALSILHNNWSLPCLLTIIYVVLSCFADMTPFLGIIVSAIMSVGISFTLMKMAYVFTSGNLQTEKVSFSTFLEALEDRWLVSLLAGLWNALWVILWSLLFIIPGIVKAYSYSMMFYVVAENPKIGAIKAMDISKILTQGHKADLFIMDLSFLGWIILSILSCGIGFIWLYPYMTMTEINAYYDLKRMAFAQSKLTPADFEA